MSDTIQVSAPTSLEHDMRMPYEWLTRTASAIINASDLKRENTHLTTMNEHLGQTVATLEETRNSLERTLGDTAANLRDAVAREQALLAKLQEKEREVTDLGNKLAEVTTQRDNTEASLRQTEEVLGKLQDEHIALGDAFGEASAKLGKFREILGLPSDNGHAPEPAKFDPPPKTTEPIAAQVDHLHVEQPHVESTQTGVQEVTPTHVEPTHNEPTSFAIIEPTAEVKQSQAFWDYSSH